MTAINLYRSAMMNLMRASARRLYLDCGGCAAAPDFTKHVLVFRRTGRRLCRRSNSLQANLLFVCPKKSQQKKRHPANAACGCSALRVPARRSPTRYAQTRLACLLSGTAMLDALGGDLRGGIIRFHLQEPSPPGYQSPTVWAPVKKLESAPTATGRHRVP